MKTATGLLSFAAIFTALALLGVAISFATDHWQDFIVNRGKLKERAVTKPSLLPKLASHRLYFTSHRGLFRTCYPGNETAWIDDEPNKVDGGCLSERGYELTRNPDTVNFGADYETRIHLMRAHFAFFCLSLLFLLIGCIFGAIGCWSMGPRVIRSAGLIVFFGAFFMAAGMAVFHGYEYLEKNAIRQSTFPAKWMTDVTHSDLRSYSSLQYGYSYMLGWVGMGVAAIGAILYLAAAWSVTVAEEEEKRPLDRRSRRSKKSKKYANRNRAYDYMDREDKRRYPELPPTEYYAGRGQPYPSPYDYGGYRY